MKFSPVLPFALSTLITTSLAAPHALRQPVPESAPVSVGRRSSEVNTLLEAQPVKSADIDHVINFGMGEPLAAVKDKRQIEPFEGLGQGTTSSVQSAADKIGFGMGKPLAAVKDKRQIEPFEGLGQGTTSSVQSAADKIGFGMGKPLAAVKDKRQIEPFEGLGGGTASSAQSAADEIGFGMGEALAPVSRERLAIREDPIIRSKVAELSALLKERAPEASLNDVLIREASPVADTAAPAA